ncbi:class I SAM-dependent methyltransferase [Streptomyces sp. NPDC056975]|uniref:class I SAM-dependent methyltransferase n=1 Tax=unclassified Streptomyces TaxID=2593676 RepID=UPI00363C5A59
MNSGAWDAYAEAKHHTGRTVNTAGESTWFNWTQYADHGPGAELLGTPATALDLGCGKGRNAAHLAKLGVRTVGIDIAAARCEHAAQHWKHLEPVSFVHADALTYLESSPLFDAVISVFGAVWFTDPDALLPAIHGRLTGGGVLAFSHEPPVAGSYGAQGAYVRAPGQARPHAIRRWEYEPGMWADLLRDHGFTDINATIVAAPDSDSLGTLLVTARR